jgi:hypothetical protein
MNGPNQSQFNTEKNIRIRSSEGGFTARVFNATGSQVEKSLSNIERLLEFYASEIVVINPPMIQFKTQQGEAHVDFELF